MANSAPLEQDDDPAIAAAYGGQALPSQSSATEDDDPAIKLAYPAAAAPTKPTPISGWTRAGQTAWGAAKEAGTQVGDLLTLGAVSHPGPVTAEESAAAKKALKEIPGEAWNAIKHPSETYNKATDAMAGWMERAFPHSPTAAQAQESGRSLLHGAEVLAPFAGSLRAEGAGEGLLGRTSSSLDHPQSIGAGRAAFDLSKASPELQQAVAKTAQKTGGVVNPDVLARQAEADSLPVKMNLSEGQALRDPTLFSDEMNNRAKSSGMPAFLNDQHSKLIQNVQAIRDDAGPEVFTSNPVDHGDTLIAAYKEKAAMADTDISSKYQALKDANGGQFPVDAPALLNNATSALHKDLLFDHAPKAIMSTLGRLSDANNMTFENFESLRTNLARIQRSASADGNEKAAAGVIRNSMEELPLQPGAAALKPLADSARAAARTQFSVLEADPAYKAAVNGDVPADRFVQRFIIGAPRDAVATMRANLADNNTASQTMGVATIDHLRQAAGINSQGEGTFSQAGFNRALEAQSPKLQAVLQPKHAEQLQALGNVARNIQKRPPGAYVNESNTFVAGAKHAAAGTAETLANMAVPFAQLGTRVRPVLEARRAESQVKAATAPGAGLGRLSDLVKPP